MTTTQLAKKVKAMIKKDFGMTFTELKNVIKKTHTPQCGSDHFKSENGYSVFYTDNDNYMQGKRNGGGVGFYASLNGVGFCRTIKL
jgi:hypothetical protein|tara:strand:- start:697 stop:954 length:258 start_codon:yes stop_codon:yes gene_type:complete